MHAQSLKNGLGFFKRLLGGNEEINAEVHVQATRGACVLVVDDSPTICAVLGKMLGLEDYAVLKAGDGASALELARSAQPALIFLDVVMPGMNGFSVLRKLRHDPATCDIPIVMISGNQQATEQFYLQRYGADDFMRKPFDRDDVCQRISQLVSTGRLQARTAADPIDALAQMPGAMLDAIPDVAMPDVEHQLPESSPQLLRTRSMA